ncbi:MAG: hypothetical protein IKH85_02760 [Methanobrevibacter sp.]|uniref:C1 family peptidase n=1 Tax=Methanobrevibacter sp. TaxID=66852 RepID=UPI0025EFF608|nr:C1 family peptidase [Methanobrevibacter sp.]MBR6992980.1 hypothetical protein [Methanobrevibacter sp.]
MSKYKIIAVMLAFFLLIMIVPTTFAMENQTASEIAINDSDVLDSEYYFDAGIDNDDGNGTKYNPYKVLKDNKIDDNSIIHLEDGEYEVMGNINHNNLTFIGKGSQNTIIKNAFFKSSSLTLINLTLQYSSVTDSSNLIAKNVVFKQYSGTYGVINSDVYKSQINIYNCTFEDNHAQIGGAIYIANNKTVLNIFDSTFINNNAQEFGGAIASEYDVAVTIKRSKFINDKSANDIGGAIYVINSKSFICEDSQFINCAAAFGGAIASLSSNVTLINVTAKNNKAKYNGGAFYSMYGYITLKNSLFNNNSAINGGAIFVDGAEIFNIYSNKFTKNVAENTAGGVYCLLSEIFYDTLFDEALNNTFSKNKAKFANNAYKSDTINLTIGDGNYILFKLKDSSFSSTLPTSYDLRNLKQVTSVKNQGSGGNCWAFTTLAALESCILKATGKTYDLSEENMKNVMSLFSDYGWSMTPNKGGYDDMGVGYLTAWLGPVNDNEDKYFDKSIVSPLLHSLMHVQNVLFLSRSDYTDNDAIKRALMDYGAVATCIYWSSSYLKDSKNYYNYGTSGANHAVTIVGWDDNYSRYNFNKTNDTVPEGDGAWIIKNSWGTSGGVKGYYYVSYYDKKIATVNKTDVSYTFILNDTVKFDKNYQYDIPGRTDYFLNSSSSVWYKNRFTATDNEYLAAVSTYFEKETSWDLSIYVNKVLKHTQSGKSPSSYSTINLNQMIPLRIGDVFEIEFKITVDVDAGVPISEAVSLNNMLYSEDTSFISYDGENWKDLYELVWSYTTHTYKSQVACIKAFTVLNPNDNSSKVGSLEQVIVLDNLNVYLNKDYRFSIEVQDKSGNALVDKKVSFKVNGQTFTKNTNRDGIIVLDYVFDRAGKYSITISSPAEGNYLKSTVTKTLNVKSSIVLPSTTTYTLNSNYVFSLANYDGSPLADKELTVSIGSRIDTVFTDAEGKVYYNIDLKSGNYAVTIKSSENNESVSQNIKVVDRISQNKGFTAYYGAGKSYKVKVVNDNGKAVKNLKVTFRVNGKDYYRYTDSKGYAYLKIGLKPGKYTITASYNGFKVSNRITIKSTIVTKNIAVKKGKTIKFKAKLLNSKGKILKYKKVTFKFKEKTYKVKTNKYGNAILKITKKYRIGRYTITSTYGSLKISNKITIKK